MEAHQAAQPGGNVPRAGSGPDSVRAQNLCSGQVSANSNSAATKAAARCVVANDGSNAANGHGSNIAAHGSNGGANGSNTGNGDSTTQPRHMYTRRLPDGTLHAVAPPGLLSASTCVAACSSSSSDMYSLCKRFLGVACTRAAVLYNIAIWLFQCPYGFGGANCCIQDQVAHSKA